MAYEICSLCSEHLFTFAEEHMEHMLSGYGDNCTAYAEEAFSVLAQISQPVRGRFLVTVQVALLESEMGFLTQPNALIADVLCIIRPGIHLNVA
jgi:hypothetical protein